MASSISTMGQMYKTSPGQTEQLLNGREIPQPTGGRVFNTPIESKPRSHPSYMCREKRKGSASVLFIFSTSMVSDIVASPAPDTTRRAHMHIPNVARFQEVNNNILNALE
jgi:hypothetical protein